MKPDVDADAQALALTRACAALWTATLSLMTAYMHNAAPAHRYLIARRVARNLDTLQAQECFGSDCRARFSKLSGHWEDKADRIARQENLPCSGIGLARPRCAPR